MSKDHKNDFKSYYSDNESDFSFREKLIRDIYLTKIDAIKDSSKWAEESIKMADVLLEKMFKSL